MKCKEPGCNSVFACANEGDPKYGYCFKHAVKNKLVPEEKLKEIEEKRRLSLIDSWRIGPNGKRISRKAREKLEQAAEKEKAALKGKEKTEAEKKAEREEAAELIHKILGDQNFDATSVVEDLKEMAGVNFRFDAQSRKFVFMSWFLADPKTRTPQTLYELCHLLDMPLTMGKAWTEADWFVSDLQTSIQKSMKLAMPYLARVVLGKALQGDFNSVKEFIKLFGKHEQKEGESDWSDLLDDSVLQEAEAAEEANN